ncbi:MAG: proline/glycine betaine ABC transporter permease [Desulfosporosinus sp.]|nr:proline/glycine betaine ABC transporter permease [Desulfosporosinus sp.]
MYRIPLGQFISNGVDWLLKRYGHFFDAFSVGVNAFIHAFKDGLNVLPWWLFILIVGTLAWRVKGWRLTVGSTLGLLLIYNMQLWPAFIDTLVLVLISALVSIIIGLPLGIIAARNHRFQRLMYPVLDFMQTMPSFVYLIPALMFFGLGTVPAVLATVVFAMPPVIRLTNLGITQVPVDLVEVGEAFGSTPSQLLWKIQLPLAMPTIMAGINQTMMLSLSMVVIAAMIGSGGFGQGVLAGIAQMDIGKGFENGLAVVILAMILDRLSQGFIPARRKVRNPDKRGG